MSFMFLVSAWLLLYAKWTISQLYDEMIMMSDQTYTNTLSWIFILLTHGSNSKRVHISLHLDTVSWFRPNRSLFFLFIAVYFLLLCTFYCCVLFNAVYFLLLCTFYCCVLFNAVYFLLLCTFSEKQQIPILWCLVWPDRDGNHTRGWNAFHYTTSLIEVL